MLGSVAVVAGCQIVSGLDNVMVPETPAGSEDSGGDAAIDQGRDADGPEDGGASRDDAPLDTAWRDEGSADALVVDATDGACRMTTRTGARDETATLQGMFVMGADADAGPDFADSVPRQSATLDPFALDKFEVTVARFRRFVDDYSCWRSAGHPAENEGAVGGRGWQVAWTQHLVSETDLRTSLACDADAGSPRATWRESAGDASAENLPIDCVTWFEALAFCIWDEGRLPTEAEWEFAAGGALHWPYTTGLSEPFPGQANFASPSGGPRRVDVTSVVEAYGTRYLAGNVAEWVLDGKGSYKTSCSSTANCETVPGDLDPRGVRGGSWSDGVVEIQTARRTFRDPTERSAHVGFRCTRDASSDR